MYLVVYDVGSYDERSLNIIGVFEHFFMCQRICGKLEKCESHEDEWNTAYNEEEDSVYHVFKLKINTIYDEQSYDKVIY